MIKALIYLVFIAIAFAIHHKVVGPSGPTVGPDCEGVEFFGSFATPFNTFVFGNFYGSNADTQGRLFAGGNITLASWAIGCQATEVQNCIRLGDVTCANLTANGQYLDFLVAGGDLSVTDVQVNAGNTVYGGTFTESGFTHVSDCDVIHRTTDFSAAKTFLENLSNQIAGLASTGTVLNSYGTLTLQGTNDGTIEVFSVDASLLANANGIEYSDIRPTASVFINVVGGDSLSIPGFQFFTGNIIYENTLWNFPDITTLTFSNIAFMGSILAPFADIVNPTGVIWGQTFAKSWISEGTTAQENWKPFKGCLPVAPPTPPPSGEDICEDAFGEIASRFNTFVFGDYECYDSDVEGRLAAGGNISVGSFAIGCQVSPPKNGSNCIEFNSVQCYELDYVNSVVAGGDFTSYSLQVYVGNVIYGGEYNGSQNTNLASNCSAQQGSPIDFDSARSFLSGESACLSLQLVTGSTSFQYKMLTLTGTQSDREVFFVDGNQFQQANTFTIVNVKSNATIIINVSGKNLAIGNFGFMGDNDAQKTLFNFYEAEVLNLFSVGWKGSILAPSAVLLNPSGNINGQLFAAALLSQKDKSCIQQNKSPFNGCLPTCVPS